MTKDLAYTRPLVCRMWALLGPHVQKHNYSVWRDMDCSLRPGEEPFPAIQDVNVGPRGEYNREWVKPGKPLMDFGGHDDFGRSKAGGAGVSSGGAGTDSRVRQPGATGKRMDGRGVRRTVPNKGHGLRVMGQDAQKSKIAGPDDTMQTVSLSAVTTTTTTSSSSSSGTIAGSMTLQQARDIPGVGKIGETKPAWD